MAGKSIHVIRAQAGLDIQPLVQGLNQASQRVKQFATESKQAMETSDASTLDTLKMLGGGPSERTVQLKKQQEEEKKLWLIQQARARDERRNADMAKLNADIADRKLKAARESMALDRQAAAVKAMLTTEEERHNARVKQYDNLLKNNRLTVEQHAAAVKMSANALAMQRGGFGRMSGAMTQASFAVEDFAQVMSMGGGLNMALMSASNNLSMVVRSLFATNAAMSAVAGLAIPFVMIGISALFRKTEEQDKAFERYTERLNDYFRIAGRYVQEYADKVAHARALEDIDVSGVSSSEEASKQLLDNAKERLRLEEDLIRAREDQANTVRNMMDEEESFAEKRKQELDYELRQRQRIGGPGFGPGPNLSGMMEEYNTQVAIVETARENLRLNLLASQSAEDYRNSWLAYLQEIAPINSALVTEEQRRVEQMLDNQDQLQDEMNKQLEINREIEESEERRIQLEQRRIDLLKEEEQARQDQLTWMRATEEERAAIGLERQRQEFVGITPSDIMADPQLKQDYLQRSTEFLLAAQEQTQRQIDELQKVAMPAFTGELQQDAFRAQAEAFKQMDQARQEKRNPQLDQQIDLLRRINDALQSGGTITLVGGP